MTELMRWHHVSLRGLEVESCCRCFLSFSEGPFTMCNNSDDEQVHRSNGSKKIVEKMMTKRASTDTSSPFCCSFGHSDIYTVHSSTVSTCNISMGA